MKKIKLDLSMNQPLDEWEKHFLEKDVYIQVGDKEYSSINKLLEKSEKVDYIPFQIHKDLYEKLLINAKRSWLNINDYLRHLLN